MMAQRNYKNLKTKDKVRRLVKFANFQGNTSEITDYAGHHNDLQEEYEISHGDRAIRGRSL
jgi:hypothetical protein